MTGRDFHVQRTADNQVDEFCSILKEVALWLESIDQKMWGVAQVAREHVLEEYSIDEMFLGYWHGIPAATMVLQEADDHFWPSANQGDSLFLHKLSVKRSFAKQGLGTQMIRWAKNEAIRRQKRYLRLDCAADRPKLCSFYESFGFVKVREQLMGKYPTAFYEMELLTVGGGRRGR